MLHVVRTASAPATCEHWRWTALVRSLGSPMWALDRALSTRAGRRERHDEIDKALAHAFADRPRDEIDSEFRYLQRRDLHQALVAHVQSLAVRVHQPDVRNSPRLILLKLLAHRGQTVVDRQHLGH